MTYKAAAMEFGYEWVLAWLQVFRHKDADFDCMGADVLVRRTVHMKTIEAGLRRGVVEWRHGGMRRELRLKL
jgi:hypothetical protein